MIWFYSPRSFITRPLAPSQAVNGQNYYTEEVDRWCEIFSKIDHFAYPLYGEIGWSKSEVNWTCKNNFFYCTRCFSIIFRENLLSNNFTCTECINGQTLIQTVDILRQIMTKINNDNPTGYVLNFQNSENATWSNLIKQFDNMSLKQFWMSNEIFSQMSIDNSNQSQQFFPFYNEDIKIKGYFLSCVKCHNKPFGIIIPSKNIGFICNNNDIGKVVILTKPNLLNHHRQYMKEDFSMHAR